MVKKSHKLFVAIFGIIVIFILSFKLYIDKEKQKAMDNELAIELHEEQTVQNTVRSYVIALKRHDIEKYNSVVTQNSKINIRSLYFTKIMSNIIDVKFVGDNLSSIHLKKEDFTTTIQVKYDITFPDSFNPEGIYNNGLNKCKVLIDLVKEDHSWLIKKIYNLKVDTYS